MKFLIVIAAVMVAGVSSSVLRAQGLSDCGKFFDTFTKTLTIQLLNTKVIENIFLLVIKKNRYWWLSH